MTTLGLLLVAAGAVLVIIGSAARLIRHDRPDQGDDAPGPFL